MEEGALLRKWLLGEEREIRLGRRTLRYRETGAGGAIVFVRWVAPQSRGLPPLLREAALSLALFSGITHLAVAVVLALMVLGVVADGTGGVLLLAWPLSSLLASVVLYRRVEERRRSRAFSSFVVSRMQALSTRVIALYPRPVDDPRIAEVFELYRRAQSSLEQGKLRVAGETIERGVELADELLTRGAKPAASESGPA